MVAFIAVAVGVIAVIHVIEAAVIADRWLKRRRSLHEFERGLDRTISEPFEATEAPRARFAPEAVEIFSGRLAIVGAARAWAHGLPGTDVLLHEQVDRYEALLAQSSEGTA